MTVESLRPLDSRLPRLAGSTMFTIPSFDQARRFWYQWFLCTDGGPAFYAGQRRGPCTCPLVACSIAWDT
jgi:hypothetical protein